MTITAHEYRQQQSHDQEGHHVSSAMLTHADQTDQQQGLHSVATLEDMLFEPVPTGEELPCQLNPAELWFAELPADVELAKQLCGPCPIREACLAGALRRSEPWGVWGGQLLLRGVVVPRKRPRGRPRKNEVAA